MSLYIVWIKPTGWTGPVQAALYRTFNNTELWTLMRSNSQANNMDALVSGKVLF